jgi:hypothetical protein
MNELLVIFYILATIAVAYLLVYPRLIGENVKLMAWVDIPVTAVPLGISALLFWESDPVFKFIFFETNWFVYTLVAMVIIELPVLILYLRARDLSKQYWEMIKSSFGVSKNSKWSIASAKSVEKQLNDTRWDGLRTIGAKRILFFGANAAMLFGTGFLFAVGDNAWAIYSLIHILLIGVFWFLLRQSVRQVADAPDEALDEMLIKRRNESYVVAFRWLALFGFAIVTALMVFAIYIDGQESSDGFNYQLNLTWPQVQAIFWFFAGYSFMLPSLAMTYLELNRGKKLITKP